MEEFSTVLHNCREFFELSSRLLRLCEHFKASLSAKSVLRKSIFIPIEIGTNYHNKDFALRVALKERLRETRKWPTVCSSTTVIRIERLRNILIQMQVL